jgi:hypothetical protein
MRVRFKWNSRFFAFRFSCLIELEFTSQVSLFGPAEPCAVEFVVPAQQAGVNRVDVADDQNHKIFSPI